MSPEKSSELVANMERVLDVYKPPYDKRLFGDLHKIYSASAFYETFKSKEAKRFWDHFDFVFTPYTGAGY